MIHPNNIIYNFSPRVAVAAVVVKGWHLNVETRTQPEEEKGMINMALAVRWGTLVGRTRAHMGRRGGRQGGNGATCPTGREGHVPLREKTRDRGGGQGS
ncbi:hypothetical protein E2C01_102822 [Portunus trituberculatus]|uniref:Uncharacterized protein n=1 Tax=Portunus trituberculatus TaxID=210409 RepID=A0A5B7KE82_PORTR|nr:hypothetical protein [Portunus trituberculatus]